MDHGRGRFWFSLIVLAVPSGTAGPSIRSLNHPAFSHWREALACWGTELHFDFPAWTMLRQPSGESMVVILGIAKDRLQAGKVLQTDLREQCRRGRSIIDLGARKQDGHQQAQGIDQQMPLASRDFRSCTWTLRINAAGHLSAVMQTSQRPRSRRSRHKARSWCLFDLTSPAVRTRRV